MFEIRRTKVLRDVWVARGRMAMMVAALTVSLVALGGTLGGYAIMTREMNRAYLATLPAAATLDTQRVTPELLAAVRRLPNVRDAQARATVQGRVLVGQDWRALMLFVVADFDRMDLARIQKVRGAWPPPPGTFLAEQVALQVLEAGVGDAVVVKPPHGPATTLTVSGVAYDAGVAPATMERTVYGYITPETLALLGERGGLDELKITLVRGGEDIHAVEETAAQVARWLQQQGREVHAISVPPPNKHPHQGQMNAVMLMLNLFSAVSLVLSGMLVASVMAALMARQRREMGILKAVGGTPWQVAWMYAGMVALLGVAASMLALVPGTLAAQGITAAAARGLNVVRESVAVPWWVYLTQVMAGVLVPLVAALRPVLQAARRPVQDAFTSGSSVALTTSPDWMLALGHALGAPVRLGLRNALRTPGRLVLNLVLLAAGGAIFLTAANVRDAWAVRLAEVESTRHYDVEVQLQQRVPAQDLERLLGGVAGVRRAEAWWTAAAAAGTQEGPPLNHAYPDRGHGVFRMVGVPPGTTLVDLPVVEGRLLRADDDGVTVVNHLALPLLGNPAVGTRIRMTVDGLPVEATLVGVVRDLGSPATAYVPLQSQDPVASQGHGHTVVRVATAAQDAPARAQVVRAVQDVLDAQNLPVTQAVALNELKTAIGEHMAVLLGILLGLAALMTLVGALGLMAAMGIAVVERTRELGIMLAVGATPRLVRSMLLVEGVLVGALSAALATVFAAPLSVAVGGLVGGMAFRLPLPLVMNPAPVAVWFAGVVVLAAAATLVPAGEAARMRVRDALAHV